MYRCADDRERGGAVHHRLFYLRVNSRDLVQELRSRIAWRSSDEQQGVGSFSKSSPGALPLAPLPVPWTRLIAAVVPGQQQGFAA